MAGNINLPIKVTSIKSSSLDSLLTKIKKIQEASTIKLKVESEGLSELNKQMADITKKVSFLRKEYGKINTAIKSNTKFTNENSNAKKKQAKEVDNLISHYMMLQTSMKTVQWVGGFVSELVKIDESMFNLGVVAGKTGSEIEEMKWQLIELSTKYPQASTDIADAIDLVARTGLSFSDSLATVQAGLILATASGESLSSIASVLAKSLVAFSLRGEDAQKAINSFYSAVLQTPLSLEGLSQSMKNSASSFATLIEFTKKSGSALQDYKEDLLDLQVAMTAGLAKLGLGASQSGTVIRGFIGRLISAEKTAVGLFDGLNLQFEGASLTFEKFSKIASEDVFKALNVLSSNFDKLAQNRDVLKSMFTQRQWARIAPILKQMNGDVEGFVDKLVTGKDASEGMGIQMKSFSNQVKIFNNNVLQSKKVFLEATKVMGSDLLPVINMALNAFGNMEDGIGKTTIQIGTMIAGVMALQTGLSALFNLSGFSKAGAFLINPMSLAVISGIVLATATYSLTYDRIIKNHEKENRLLNEHSNILKDIQNRINSVNSETEVYLEELKKDPVKEINESWKTQIDLIDKSIDQIKLLGVSIEEMSKFKMESIDDIGNFEDSKKNKKTQEDSFKTAREGIKSTEILIQNLKKEQSELLEQQDKFTLSRGFLKDSDYGTSKEVSEKLKSLKNQITLQEGILELNKKNSKQIEKNILLYEEEASGIQNITTGTIADYQDKVLKFADQIKERNESISEMIGYALLETKADSFEEWAKVAEEYMPSIKSVLDEFKDFDGDKLTLVTSKSFEEFLPYLKFIREEISGTTDQLEIQNNIVKEMELTYDQTNQQQIDLLDIEKGKSIAYKKNLTEMNSFLASIVEIIKNSKELNNINKETTDIYKLSIEELDELREKSLLQNLKGMKLLKAEEALLKNKKNRLEDVISTYDSEKSILEDIAKSGKIIGEEMIFEGDKAKELSAEYKKQKKKVEEIDKSKKDMNKNDEDIIKNAKEQTEDLEKISDLKIKKELLFYKGSKKSKKELVELEKNLSDEIAGSAEYLQLEYEIEVKKLEIQDEQLQNKIKQNKELLSTIDMTGKLFDKITGTNISETLGSITSLFEKDSKGQNMFQTFGGMFDKKIPTMSTDNMGNFISGSITKEGTGMSMAGLSSMLGMAGAGYTAYEGIKGYLDSQDAKNQAKMDKQLEVLEKQLSVMTSLRDNVSGYTKSAIDELSKLPTLIASQNAKVQSKIAYDTMIESAPDLSFRWQERNGRSFERNIMNSLMGNFEGTGGLDLIVSEAIREDYLNFLKESGGSAEDLVTQLNYISTTDWLDIEDIANLSGDFIKTGNTEANWEAVQEKAKEYLKILEDINLLTKDEALRQATFLSFDLIDFKSSKEYRKELEDTFGDMKEVLEMTDEDFSSMIDSMMTGYQEVTTQVASTIRDNIATGNSAINSFSDTFSSMSNDINAQLMNIQFGEAFDNINSTITSFYTSLGNTNGSLTDTDSLMRGVSVTVSQLTVEMEKLMGFNTINVLAMSARELINRGYDIDEVISEVGISLKDMEYTTDEINKLWNDGLISWETVNSEIGDYLSFQEMVRHSSMTENEILKEAVDLAQKRVDLNSDDWEARQDLFQAQQALNDQLDESISATKDAFLDMFNASSYQDVVDSLGNYFYDTMLESRNKVLGDQYGTEISALQAQADSAQTLQDYARLQAQISSLSARAESERMQRDAISSVLNPTQNVEYQSETGDVTYQAGSTQSIIYNNYNTVRVEFNNSIGFSEEAGTEIGEALVPYIEKASEGRNA